MRSHHCTAILHAAMFLVAVPLPTDCYCQDSNGEVTSPQAAKIELSPEDLYEKASKAVVRIITKNGRGQEIGSGSGFLLDESYLPKEKQQDLNEKWRRVLRDHQGGIVLTNHHVIEGAASATVEFSDRKSGFLSDVVVEDVHSDLAIVEVAVPKTTNIDTLSLANSLPAIGSTVFAIGNPLGLKATLSDGLVSGFRIDRQSGTKELQTNAAISPGSSGGPLLNGKGEVVGVITSSLVNGQNLNFATPVPEIRQLISGLRTVISTGTGLRTAVRSSVGRQLWKGTSLEKEVNDVFFSLRLTVGRSFGNAENRTDLVFEGVKAYQKNDFEDAIQLFKKAEPFIDRRHRHLWHYAIGRAYFDLAWADGSLDPEDPNLRAGFKALTDSLEMNPDFAPTRAELLRWYFFQQNLPRQLTESDALVRLMPRCAYAYRSRGDAYWKLKDNESAVADLMIAVRLDPRDSESFRILGELHLEEDKFREAITLFKKALAEDSVTGGGLAIHMSLGRVYQKIHDYELAIKHYRKALSRTTSDYFASRIRKSIEDCVIRLRN